MNFKLRLRFFVLVTVLTGLAGMRCIAQPLIPSDGERNIRLKIQLDRVSIKAFEPVYLSISAEQFVQNVTVEIAIRKDGGDWQSVVFVKDPAHPDPWHKFESKSLPGLPKTKFGIPLLAGMVGDRPRYLFSTAGSYKIHVKVGPDSTNLDLNVNPAADDDERSANILGPELFAHVFDDDYHAKVDPLLRDASIRVMAEFPGSTIRNYCEAYLHTAVFRDDFQKHSPPVPNPAVFARLADELDKSAEIFRDSFFGEELLFYAAYAHGLNLDFPGLLKDASLPHSTLTPWADALAALKKDVERHLSKKANAPIPLQQIPN